MGFLNWIFGEKTEPEQSRILAQNSPKLTAIGNTEPICPYCNNKFNKMPLKMKRCPKCGNFIRSRTRPLDNRKVLIKETQLEELGRQWASKNEQSGINRVISSPVPLQIKKPSVDEIQTILDKPWSEVTKEDRKTLCTQYLGVHFSGGVGDSKGEYMNKFPKKSYEECTEEMIQITKTWVIPPEGCPIEVHELLDGQTVDAQDMFEIPSGEYQGFKADGPGLFGDEELDDNCKCWLVSGIKKR